ncbi:MAG: hypothetical protein JWN84_4642 [Nocardioides sp.]|nr:hypothetical protein [Nocardioides sp.]
MERWHAGATAYLVVGLGLLQALWIVTVPPFAASDEFDHAFRAAGAATGQLALRTPAPDGRGELVAVPRQMVEAASAQCASLPYTGEDNCYPVRETSDGRVLVATAAGTYHPGFYALIGTFARPLDGAGALYVMRTAAALLCLALVALAAWLQRRRGPWVRASIVLSLTPTLVYTSVVGAPNGLEIAAGLLLWVALLELSDHEPTPQPVLTFWSAVGAASLLVTLRLLGPIFLMAVAGVVAVLGAGRVLSVMRPHRVHVGAGALVLATAGALSAAWILHAGQLAGEGRPDRSATPLVTAVASGSSDDASWGLITVVVWQLQTIAAFPYRDQPGPIWVYPLLGGILVLFVVAGWRAARGRSRAALALAVLVPLLLPVALTAATAASQGVIWQGRYVLPVGVGLVLLAGRMAERGAPGRMAARWPVVGGAAAAAAVAACLLKVRADELGSPPSRSDPSWWAPWPLLVVAGSLVGTGLMVLYVLNGRSTVVRSAPVGPSTGPRALDPTT